MTCLHGGGVLYVDLSRREWRAVPSERYVREYVGGHGLAVSLLFAADAARGGLPSGGTVVCLAAGALAGTAFPGCAVTDLTWTAGASAPAGRASLPGGWAAELKQAGWDAVVLEGRAERPVYVSVRNDAVELRDAREVWGAACGAAARAIRAELGSPDARVACAGPAGERRLVGATVHGDLGAAEGAAGSGAALGAMNCKAVVVRGTRGIRLADPGAFLDAALAAHDAVRSSPFHRQVHGWGAPEAPRAWRHARAGCACCPVSCRDSYGVPGRGGVVLPHEARTALWPELRERDPRRWFDLVRQCDREGLDVRCATASAPGPTGSGEPPPVRLESGADGGLTATVAGLVGACRRLAGADGDPLGPDHFAAALAAGLGTPAAATGLLRAAERTRRLEGVLARNAAVGARAVGARPVAPPPGRRLRGRASERAGEAPRVR